MTDNEKTTGIKLGGSGGKTIRTYLEELDHATPEQRGKLMAQISLNDQAIKLMADKLREAADPQPVKNMIEQLRQAAEQMKRIQPFIDAIFEAFPGEEWYTYLSVKIIITPIGAYMQDRGLHDGADIDAHRKSFLAFFKEYIDEMEAAYQPGADLETLQETTLKKLAGRGLLKGDELITSVGGRQLSITDIDYQYALTPLRNSNAYISPLRDEIMQKLTFENGKLSILGSEPADLKKETKNGLQEIKNLDLPLLREIFTAVYKTAVYGDAHTVTIHIPSFCREMGIDVRRVPEQEEYKKAEDKADDEQAKPLKFNDVFAKMRQFENCIGISKGVYYELMRTIMIDPDRDLMTLAVPYMNHVLREIRDKNIIRDKEGKERYVNPGYSRLMHTTIASERNKPAVEIVNRIITGLMQRGSIPDAKLRQNKSKKNIPPDRVTYKITYSGLIGNIPLLKESLAASNTANKNVLLARHFKKAFELLHTETDVYQYYVGLKIPEIVPNTSALADTLTITHEGINGEYKPRG